MRTAVGLALAWVLTACAGAPPPLRAARVQPLLVVSDLERSLGF